MAEKATDKTPGLDLCLPCMGRVWQVFFAGNRGKSLKTIAPLHMPPIASGGRFGNQ